MDTGMTRKIDDLGRIVIPAETRRLFKIREGDHLSISVEGDRIVLRKMETTVAVGEHSFEVDRDTYFSWERKVAEDIGSHDPVRITEEIRRRLNL